MSSLQEQDRTGPDQRRWPERPASSRGADAIPTVLVPADRRRGRVAVWLSRHPAWPVTALLAGYPLWWAIGVADFMWIMLAIPMAWRMLGWHMARSRPLRMPPGFGLWLVFLLWTAASLVMITYPAPGTVQSPVSHRLVAYGDRTASYLAITVLFLYVVNLTESEFPRRKLAWLLGLLGIYTVALGLAGILLPAVQFTSPLLAFVPNALRNNAFILAQMRPALTQLQDVFGTVTYQGRPKAPFNYTNTWGESLTITVPWLLLVCQSAGRRSLRYLGWGTLLLALVALVYSLNRGAWIATAFAAFYLAARLAARGRVAILGALISVVVLLGVVVVVSPLGSIITLRLQNGQSNAIRSSLFALSLRDGIASPILGYGDTRQQRGSPLSIAVGPTPGCPVCGNAAVGSTGQASLLLVCTGFVGLFLYCAFFARTAWRFRRAKSPYGWIGLLVILMSFIYIFTYDAVTAPLGLTMLACALLWRDDMDRSQQGAIEKAVQMPRPRRFAIRAIEAAGTAPEATASAT